jgi:sigma-B regulation protein RsbU (phosphoserine phosphatase)
MSLVWNTDAATDAGGFMGIRYKLLILLLFISLVPLLLLGNGVRRDLTRLGEDLAASSSRVLVAKAEDGLRRIVEDHARVLGREKQLLESATLFLASRLEGIVYGHEHAMPDPDYAPPADRAAEAAGAYFMRHRGGPRPLAVDFTGLDYTGPGTAGRAAMEHAVPDPARGGADAMPVRDMLVPLLGQVKFEYPELALWITLRLPGGDTAVYPALERGAMAHGPGHGRMDAASGGESPLATRLTWSPPQVDARTGRLVFHVGAPIRDDRGALRGDVTLAVPVGALLHENRHVRVFSDNAVSLLVAPAAAPAAAPEDGGTRLRVIAREQGPRDMRDHWAVPDGDEWLTPDDAAGSAAMLARLEAAEPGVTHMPHNGSDALWAYAPVEPGGTALLIIVPKADIVAEAVAAKDFIMTRVGDHNANMGLAVLGVSVAVLVLAFFLSKLFTRDISALAAAVGQIGRGNFAARADVRGGDEIGQLGRDFNRMVPELEERVHLKNALEVAQQVQQNLLPGAAPSFHHLDMAAASIYCDETGGDYYGFIRRPGPGGEGMVVTVGDVSGHGIPAALLMSSARAYLRCHAGSGVPLDEAVRRTNALVAEDVDLSGRFMTLFALELTPDRTVRWVSAGHDPALVYDPEDDRFDELAGAGLPLGVTPDADYALGERNDAAPGRIIVLGTDGIWEMRSPGGEMFGKARLREVIRSHCRQSAQDIIDALTRELDAYRGEAEQKDDITIAVVRFP